MNGQGGASWLDTWQNLAVEVDRMELEMSAALGVEEAAEAFELYR